jgi:hypothetical protein
MTNLPSLRRALLSPVLALLLAIPSLALSADAPPPTPPAGKGKAEPATQTTGMIVGEGHLFTVEAPRGWAIQGKTEGTNGLATVFYPKGSTFADAEAVMYVNTAKRENQEKLDDFIARDLAELRKGSPNAKAEKRKPLDTAEGRRAEVWAIAGDQWGNRESIAFLAEDTVFVTLVLTARTADAYKASLPAFGQLVKSYKFISKDVKAPK